VTYRIEKLAPGAYDVFLGNEVVASLVRGGDSSRYGWRNSWRTCRPSSARRPSPGASTGSDRSSRPAPGLARRSRASAFASVA
jgi:hypothetical protein